MKEIKKEMKKMTIWNKINDENTLMNTDNYDSIIQDRGVGYIVLNEHYSAGFAGVTFDREEIVTNAFKGGYDNPTYDGENPSGIVYTHILSPYTLRLHVDKLFSDDFDSAPVLAHNRGLTVRICGWDSRRDSVIIKVRFYKEN